MRAVVLVGGFGTRLRPLTLTTPKPLLPVVHRPILELVLENLGRRGVDEAVLAVGFKPDVFLDAYPSGTCAGVRLRYAVEPAPLDTAGAIRFAALAADVDSTFVVVNGDVLTDLDVGALVAAHRASGAEGTIHLTPVEDPSAFGVVDVAADGRVRAFVEKPPRDEAPSNTVNGGTYVLEPSVLDRIPAGRPVSIERVVFPEMVRAGTLYAVATDDYWVDAGRPELFLQANLDALDGRRHSSFGSPVSSAADVSPVARITRSVVARGCQVAAGAEVRDSVLLAGSVVGEGARVERSVVGGARIGAGAILRDAVVGAGVEVAAGHTLDGVRVPEPA